MNEVCQQAADWAYMAAGALALLMFLVGYAIGRNDGQQESIVKSLEDMNQRIAQENDIANAIQKKGICS